jgi:hypothetical protein
MEARRVAHLARSEREKRIDAGEPTATSWEVILRSHSDHKGYEETFCPKKQKKVVVRQMNKVDWCSLGNESTPALAPPPPQPHNLL